MRRRRGLVAAAAVFGPGLLAGLSDDDAAGITTYSSLGADHGYRLLWVLLVSTAALVLFHELGARMGIVTGQGLAGLVRERFGIRAAAFALGLLVVANVGTTAAEFAGVAASLDLLGVTRYASVPVAAMLVSLLVLRGSFHRVEHVLLAVSTVFATYVAAGLLAGPDWSAIGHGLVVPELSLDRSTLLAATATVGTTLAPWGLAFIQSYAVDKRLTPADLKLERLDVVTGAVMTGVIGLFVVMASAEVLHPAGVKVEDARDAALALEPALGVAATAMFGAGLLGASLLAASILPLSTAYSVAEALGSEATVDDSPREARAFYGTYVAVVVVAVAIVLIPGIPLVPVLILTQALNAILLLPLLVFIVRLARDPAVMGEHRLGTLGLAGAAAMIVLLGVCLAVLLAFSL